MPVAIIECVGNEGTMASPIMARARIIIGNKNIAKTATTVQKHSNPMAAIAPIRLTLRLGDKTGDAKRSRTCKSSLRLKSITE